MPTITINVFHSLDDRRELVKTVRVQSGSDRALNGACARRLLRREFPELGYVHALFKTEQGWEHSRAIESKANCPYHFKWEHFVVFQER